LYGQAVGDGQPIPMDLEIGGFAICISLCF
jgi:hypothetical protein